MSSSRFSSLFYLLTFAFLLQAAFGADPLFHFCSDSDGNFSAYDPYEANLNNLITYLPTQASQASRSGFGLGYTGRNYKAYGLILCRGDVSTPDCKSCIVDAGSEIRNLCPNDKGAIIWYDYCLLKYSNTKFFGKIDYQNKFYLWNWNSVSDPESFNQKTKELLSHLANVARATPKLYATGEMDLYGKQKLYGLTQCTRDISRSDCKKCLDTIIGELPSCCNGKEGGRVVGGSCNFRYEIYPFVNA